MSDKRYSKEEVVELMYRAAIRGNGLTYMDSLDMRLLIKDWIIDNNILGTTSHKTPTVDKDRIERYDKPNTTSYDKVMKAIERAEVKCNTHSKHIHTLQQAVNTLLDYKIDSTWFTTKRPKTTQSLESMREEYKDKYTVSTWWSRLMNRNN